MMILEKYSFGTGDRFGQEGKAQLRALMKAADDGVEISAVWNKSHREHTIIGTEPSSVRREANSAVGALGWGKSYYVDADHINLNTVDLFIESSDFFTIDVADFIGKSCGWDLLEEFTDRYEDYLGELKIEGIDEVFPVTVPTLEVIGVKFLLAVREAGRIYRRIVDVKGKGNFITEISMDETDKPQSPLEMFFILGMLADEGVAVQTIAPKFTGRFNKGVDYVGDAGKFAIEFEQDLAVINSAVKKFDLPGNLKLSIHSGSDKFSIYPVINKAIRKFDAGLHVKTAGTTWLEEVIGLAAGGGAGLLMAKGIYAEAIAKKDELCRPYANVIDIDENNLPGVDEVNGWSSEQFVNALRHDQSCEEYNRDFRQLLHVAYKIAAELGSDYIDMLGKYEDVVAKNVTENIYERHLKPIFID
ncbi:MAG TPA: tagaturonate epimerase family protein [Sedimentisphaerales bacterium]|nr:tagaturonate epimerase family protein [Sedimentisphaerales bacterium]